MNLLKELKITGKLCYQNNRFIKKNYFNLKCLIRMYFVNIAEHVTFFHCQIGLKTKSGGI